LNVQIGYWAIILNEKLAPGYPLVEVQPLRVQITEIISTTPFKAHVKPLAVSFGHIEPSVHMKRYHFLAGSAYFLRILSHNNQYSEFIMLQIERNLDPARIECFLDWELSVLILMFILILSAQILQYFHFRTNRTTLKTPKSSKN
jgi:hypothetical protein